jgi:alkanesulfonate monooxygenase SsuD/methylene tetrahydromethanopterin reductase-like flavin-dependent oxidoreductase (luciferase family)
MTGEIADGWLGTSFMPDHARVFTDHLAAGAARAGRSLAALDLQAGGFVAFGDDAARLVPARKPGLAFTLAAMGSRQHNFYNDAFRRAGYEEVAREVQRLWRRARGAARDARPAAGPGPRGGIAWPPAQPECIRDPRGVPHGSELLAGRAGVP